jgi:hypothetical protein
MFARKTPAQFRKRWRAAGTNRLQQSLFAASVAMPKFDNPLDYQFAGEAAASLGQAGRRLREALDALKNYDSQVASGARVGNSARREAVVAAAAEAFWGYVVQRELLGLQDSEYIAREYQVPKEVVATAGPKTSKPSKQ